MPVSPERTPRRRLVVVLLLALSLLLGGLVTSALRPVSASAATGVCDTNEFSCWMGRFADTIGQRPLNQVVQPGSHDTGTYNIQNYGSLARNQDATVYDQLARGVRQFDMRAHPRTLNGRTDLYAYHGSVDTDVKLTTMLDDVKRYTTSAGTSKEIVYLQISTDKDSGGQLLKDTCRSIETSMGKLALTPSLLYSGDQMKSMNEIWALSGAPRIIFEWDGCGGVSPFWDKMTWSANGTYYADQGNTPCVKYAVTKALEGRWSGTEDVNKGHDVPYSYEQGNPCWNTGNVPLGSQPMTRLYQPVTGLYTMFIQQTGLVPSSALYVQRDVMSMLVDYWERNVGSARANLNYVSADYVLDGGTSLITKTVGLNTRSPLPKITATFDASSPDPAKWRYVYTCNTLPENASGTTLTAWDSLDLGTNAGAVRISDSSLSLPIRSTGVLRCTDGNGRKARLVQANQLSAAGPTTASATADVTQLLSPATVALTDTYGNPLSGHYVTFNATGPVRLSSDGKTSAGAYTDAKGQVSFPIYLSHAVGQGTITASTALASQAVVFSISVVAGHATTISTTSGDQQTTPQGKPFGDPLVVTVKDTNGNPVAGQSVTFKVESGPGSLGGKPTASVTTGADGTASIAVQAGGAPGGVVVSATSGSLRTTFELGVTPIFGSPAPAPAPTADTSVEVKGPKKLKLGDTATIKVSVVNAGPDAVVSWYSTVAVGDGLRITATSLGAASGRVAQLAGNAVAADDAVDFTVTVRAVHRGQAGYAVLAGSDATDPDDQNDTDVRVLKVT